MPILRVLTWNVLYGGAGREESIGAVLRHLHPDIAIFTEARPTSDFEAIANAVGPHHASSGSPGSRECVIIASRWPIVRSEPFGPRWARLNWLVATIQPTDGAAVTLAGVHLIPQPLWPFELLRAREIGALLRRLAPDRPHLIAGDFNALSGGDAHHLDRAASWVRAQLLVQGGMAPRWALRRLLKRGYIDCYRSRNPGNEGFTVPAWDPQARIDYVFASRDLEDRLRSAGVGRPVFPNTAKAGPRRSVAQLLGRAPAGPLNGEASDHLPVWADFEWNEPG